MLRSRKESFLSVFLKTECLVISYYLVYNSQLWKEEEKEENEKILIEKR